MLLGNCHGLTDQRFLSRDPSTPRMISRPTCEPMLRAADLTMASTGDSRRFLPPALLPKNPPAASFSKSPNPPPDDSVSAGTVVLAGAPEAGALPGC